MEPVIPERTGPEAEGATAGITPDRLAVILASFARSVARTCRLLAGHRLRLGRSHLGLTLRFGDGTTSRVYRQTVNLASAGGSPCLLVVSFRLRAVGHSPFLHALFRAESLFNTPLFAGFPGFRSKLWLTDPATGVYRGVYEWDGLEQAVSYAATLAELLKLVCVPGSVRFHARAGITPDDVLAYPGRLGPAHDAGDRWWRFRREAGGE